MKIEWREYLAVGVKEIDDQHKELFNRFNALLEACDAGKGKEEVSGLLDFLDTYVRVHFAAEEKLQAESGFPDYAAHREMHQGFVDELTRLKEEFRTHGPLPRLVATTNWVGVGWLMDHISRKDTKVGEHLRKRAQGE